MAFPRLDPKAVRALIIGIDAYDDQKVKDLSGCVNDATKIWEWLTTDLRVPPVQIKVLLSPEPGAIVPSGLAYEEPTRQRIEEGIQWIKSSVQPGDIVFIHYSGHGARKRTIYQEKGFGQDESLVPMDYPKGDLLRDVEIGKLLEELSALARHVFVVLDCCHSGGATRGDEDDSDSESDATEREPPGSVRAHNIDRYTAIPNGSVSTTSWQFKSPTYTLLAAAQPNELARETWGPRPQGRLTRSLLERLKKASPSTTYRMLLHNIRADFRKKVYRRQNPMLYGNADQLLLSDESSMQSFDGVISEQMSDQSVTIDIGSAHGVHVGDTYEVHGLGASLAISSRVVATMHVTATKPLHSEAELSHPVRLSFQGYPIKLQSYGPRSMPDVMFQTGDDSPVCVAAMEALQKAIAADTLLSAVVTRQTPSSNCSVKFKVDVETSSSGTAYVIKDAFDDPMPNVPRLPTGGEKEARRSAKVLRHILRFSIIQGLESHRSKLSYKEYSFGLTGKTIVQDGDAVTLHFKNRLPKPDSKGPRDINSLYAYFFNLTPQYGIERLEEGQLDTALVEPQQEIFETFPMEIPDSLKRKDRIHDIIKVFITTSPTDFDPLQQADIDEFVKSPTRGSGDSESNLLLELVLSQSAMEATRSSGQVKEVKLGEWRTEQKVIQTVRKMNENWRNP